MGLVKRLIMAFGRNTRIGWALVWFNYFVGIAQIFDFQNPWFNLSVALVIMAMLLFSPPCPGPSPDNPNGPMEP